MFFFCDALVSGGASFDRVSDPMFKVESGERQMNLPVSRFTSKVVGIIPKAKSNPSFLWHPFIVRRFTRICHKINQTLVNHIVNTYKYIMHGSSGIPTHTSLKRLATLAGHTIQWNIPGGLHKQGISSDSHQKLEASTT